MRVSPTGTPPAELLIRPMPKIFYTRDTSPGGPCNMTLRHIGCGTRRTEFDFILALPLVTRVVSGDVSILSLTQFLHIKGKERDSTCLSGWMEN